MLRVSLGTVLFFSLLCAWTLGLRVPASWRGRVHTHGGPLKLVLCAGLIALCFLLHNSTLERFFQFARAGGAVFLLFQLVVILDAVMSQNEAALLRDDALSRAKLIVGALVTHCGTIAGVACMYVYLWKSQRDLAFITVTLLLYVIFTVVSLLPQVNAGLFTSGAVSAYCTYLCATAIGSDPSHSGGQPKWLQAVGFAIAVGALVYSTASIGDQGEQFDVAPSQEQLANVDEEGEPREVHPLSYSFFHLTFALGACYAVMLFTSWSNSSSYAQWTLDKGVASMWVKIACEWACAVLYLWILLAPVVMQSRDFTPT